MSLTVQSINDIQQLMQGVSAPYQALSNRTSRLQRYRSIIEKLVANQIDRELNKAETELLDMFMANIVDQGFLPGITSGGAQYNNVLGALLTTVQQRGGRSYNDQNKLQKIANFAYNTNQVINDYLYREDGTLNYNITNGLDIRIASELGSHILRRHATGKDLSEISSVINLGSNSIQMAKAIERYTTGSAAGTVEAGSELHKRLLRQQKEVEALEAEAISRFAFNTSPEIEVSTLDANGKTVKRKIKQDLDPGIRMRDAVGNELTAAEFETLIPSEQRKIASKYYQQLLKQAEQIEGTGDYRLRDSSGKYLTYRRFETNEKTGKQEEKEYILKLSDIIKTSLDSSEVQDSIRQSMQIRGVDVSQTAANILQEMIKYGNTEEYTLDKKSRTALTSNMASLSENLRFVSKSMGTSTMEETLAVAEAAGLGDLTSLTDTTNVKRQLEDLKRMAIEQNKNIQDLFRERADLVQALSPDFGGTVYVNKDFISRVHRIISNSSGYSGQDDNAIPLRNQEEIIQEISRSRSNAENLFGGFALADYSLTNLDYLDKDTRKQIQELTEEGRQQLKAGQRKEAYYTSEKIKTILEDAYGGEISYAIVRRAMAEYGYKDYELSVDSGLAQQIYDNYKHISSKKAVDLIRSETIEGLSTQIADRETTASFLTDIIAHTGSNTQTLSRMMKGYKNYYDIISGKESYGDQTGIEAADKWLATEFASSLRQRGYSEEAISTQQDIVRRMLQYNFDEKKLQSYLTTQLQNTGTRTEGVEEKARQWSNKYDALVETHSDKSFDMGIPELVIAGLVGDGSDNFNEQEAVGMRYRQWLDSQIVLDTDGNIVLDSNGNPVRKKATKETLSEFFKSQDKYGGAELQGVVVHDFDKSGSFGSKETIETFVRDKKLNTYLNKENKLEIDSEGRVLRRTSDGKFYRQDYNENGDLIDIQLTEEQYNNSKKEALSVREYYNRQIALDMLKDEKARGLLQNLGVDAQNTQSESYKLFLDRITKGGVQSLYEHYLHGSGYSLESVNGLAYIAKISQMQQASLELNKEFQNFNKVDYSQYLQDNTIDSKEYLNILSTMYGVNTPTIQELLLSGGAIDTEGAFQMAAIKALANKKGANSAGLEILAQKGDMEQLESWFFSEKRVSEESITELNNILGSNAFNKLLKKNYKGLKGYDEETGKFAEGTYAGKTPEQVLFSMLVKDSQSKAYIDTWYKDESGRSVYDIITSTDPKDKQLKAKYLDKDGRFINGEFKGRTAEQVLNQFARGAGLTERHFNAFVSDITSLDVDSLLKDGGKGQKVFNDLLDAEGKFKSGIFKGQTLEEARAWLNETAADGKTNAQRIKEYRDNQQVTNGSAEGYVTKIVEAIGGLSEILERIATNTKKEQPSQTEGKPKGNPQQGVEDADTSTVG